MTHRTRIPPADYLLPWHLDTHTTSAQAIPSTSHAWTVQHQAINITVGNPTTAGNDMWLPAHLAADGPSHGLYTMSYYERQDIPFHFALAETFTLCDAYHCSLLGPTWPNRMYLMTGMIDPEGTGGGPVTTNVVPSPFTGKPYTWTTYPERLTKAGISWRVYQEEDDYGTNPLEWFANYQDATPGSPLYENALTIYPPDRFEWDAKHDKLPTVSWILEWHERRIRKALMGTKSRYEENRTTHASDFPAGNSDKVYLAKIAAVDGKAVAASASTALAYVPGIVGGNVAIFNTSTFALASAVSGGTTNPYGIAATPDGSEVWVTESGTNTVSVINHQPTAIGLSPDGNIWVTCQTSSSLVVISTATGSVIDSTDIGLGDGPTGIAFV
jgi:hypothetical protein